MNHELLDHLLEMVCANTIADVQLAFLQSIPVLCMLAGQQP